VPVDALAFTVSDAPAIGAFYESALDFRVIHENGDRTTSTCRSVTLRLRGEVIVLDEYRRPGRPRPADTCSHDLWFRHTTAAERKVLVSRPADRRSGVEG
jgi:hypothetical protein